jgi:rod shape-determining protein MreC
MESFFTRYRDPMVLGLILLLQVFGLAVQVKRPVDPHHPDSGSVRLIRLWIAGAITPLERAFVATGAGLHQAWHDYVNVIGLRQENRALLAENERLRIERAQLSEDAGQARRLQVLLDFKSRFIVHTVAAQIIGSSGTEQSRVLDIDKGYRQGLQPDMAVITPDGVVGKVRDVFRSSAQVLLMNDSTSGVGVLLENSRLHGVVKGTPAGGVILDHIMTDEKVDVGERVLTSGGDRIFPKGLVVGTVEQVSPGNDLFWNIRIRPAANLNRLDEVLVVTDTRGPMFESDDAGTSATTADILAQRLPGIGRPAEAAQAGEIATPNPNPKASAASTPLAVTTKKIPVAANPGDPNSGRTASPTSATSRPTPATGTPPHAGAPHSNPRTNSVQTNGAASIRQPQPGTAGTKPKPKAGAAPAPVSPVTPANVPPGGASNSTRPASPKPMPAPGASPQ